MSTIEKALAKKQQHQELNNESKVKESTSAGITPNLQASTKPKSTDNEKSLININNDRLTERGFIHSGGDAHNQQEEFRHIKRKLINNAFGLAAKTLKRGNLVMVSSSNANEGKTFVSINLALSIALEQDKTVLLVDADVLRPSLHRELEFDNDLGLLDYLRGEITSLSDIIYSTNITNLKIMPAGAAHHLTNELLASVRMEKLAQELADRYPDRIVIFDCPPLLGVTETPVLASLIAVSTYLYSRGNPTGTGYS